MKLGNSVDLGFCEGTQQQCKEIVDLRYGLHCSAHRTKLYFEAKSKRQEFVVGNSIFHEGAPKDKTQKVMKERNHKCNATYRIGSRVIVACGFQAEVKSPPKPTVQKSNQNEM